MKKVYHIISLTLMGAVVLLGQSCSSMYADNEYVPDGENNRNYEDYTSYPIYVTLNHNSLIYQSTGVTTGTDDTQTAEASQNSVDLKSKGTGSGAFDKVNDPLGFDKHYDEAKFYVLAYRKTVGSTGALSSLPDFSKLMYSSNNEGKLDCLLSTDRETINGTTQQVGKLTKPENKGGALKMLRNVTWEDTPATTAAADREEPMTHYWSKEYDEVGYNFFGYYIDNAEVYGTERTSEKITMSVELNGTNDIMVGVAPEVTDSMLKADFPTSVQEESIRKEVVKRGDGGYSTYGAIHGVEPRIDLRHCLAQLVFRAVLTDEEAEGKMSITNIEVLSGNKGDLVVASRNKEDLGLTAAGEPTWRDIPDGGAVQELKYDIPVTVGSGMLLPEAESYSIKVHLFEKGLKTSVSGKDEEPWKATVREGTVSFPGGFKAGVTYYVTISAYGSTAIDLEATLSPWKNGGGAEVDFPDKY